MLKVRISIGCAAVVLGWASPALAQYDVPRLENGYPNPYSPITTQVWNANAAFTPGGGTVIQTNALNNARVHRSRIGTQIVGLGTQFGVGDELPRPDGVPTTAIPVISTNALDVVQWLTFSNTNLLVAVDEGVAVVQWTTTNGVPLGPTQSYVVGPNLTRRPVRLFWTEGQYVGPRVRFGNNYQVTIWYNSQIPNPNVNPSNATYIAQEQIDKISPPTIFLKNSELRATPNVSGRVVISYSRRPEGATGLYELLAYEVVDVLEPMSSTLSAFVADRLLPKRRDYDIDQLFCDITRGALDSSGQQPDAVFVYKHTIGARNGWVWAIRPTDSPWQIEIFWKAKEQLDVIWPFEVDIYDVDWNLDSQRNALVHASRAGSRTDVFFPQAVAAEVMPYQAVPTDADSNKFIQATARIATVNANAYRATAPSLCTLKYTSGDDVWFESIRNVWETDPSVYQGEQPWPIGHELEPFREDAGPTDAYKEWPGYLRVPPRDKTILGDDRWDRYHPTLYRYPGGYPSDGAASLESQIFAVNEGHLGAWWWNASAMSTNEGMPAPIYWPSLVCDYNNHWPDISRVLAIASFQGSTTETWVPDGTGSLYLPGADVGEAYMNVHPDYEASWDGVTYSEGFTFETWVLMEDVSGSHGIMTMPMNFFDVGGGTNFSLFVQDGTLGVRLDKLVEASSNVWETQQQNWYATDGVEAGVWTHVAVSYVPGEAPLLSLYVNGAPAGEFTDVPADLAQPVTFGMFAGIMITWDIQGGVVNNVIGYDLFTGWLDETRLWWGPRSTTEISQNFGVPIEQADTLRCRFDYDPNAPPDPDLPEGTYADKFGLMAVQLRGSATIDPGMAVPLSIPGRSYPVGGPQIYVQNDKTLPGYNPNEEHALLVGSVAFALRSDLNQADSSEPYMLVEYSPEGADWQRALDVYNVVPTNAFFPKFNVNMEAGLLIQPPPPLRSVLPDNSDKTFVDEPQYVFRDRRRYWWAKQAGDTGGALDVGMRFFYPMQNSFWFPSLATQPTPLTELPWLSGLAGRPPSWELKGTPVRVNHHIVWPQFTPVLQIGDTLTKPKNGLPAVRGQKSVRVVYQQSLKNGQGASGLLIDPTLSRRTELDKVPPAMRALRDPRSGNTFFSDLDPDLRERMFFVPSAAKEERLWLKGVFVDYPSYHYLRLNLMTPDLVAWAVDKKKMAGIDETWTVAVSNLPMTRIETPNENVPFDSQALVTPGLGQGYMTLIFNNSTNVLMVDTGDPIDMEIILVTNELFGGRIDIIQSSNPLDKYLTLRHIGDFAGKPEEWVFQWEYARPDSFGLPPTNDAQWLMLHFADTGRYSTIFGSSGEFGLADTWVRARYKALNDDVVSIVGTNWSSWTAPALAEGWIKRLLKAVNPFDQRIQDYINYALNTDLSMIQQAGQPYAGDVPLNLDALNDYGLIPIYETVLAQSRDLSIDATLDTNAVENIVNLALMLAAGRLNDLYMTLGNEAYADAMNPTLALGNEDPVLAAEASSIFAFQNIVPTLLDEELALLRGRDFSSPTLPPSNLFPIYNRLPWNFTFDITHGQVAYVLNYGISDLKGDQDGVVDADDAAALYPQGHGDAWGYYLEAMKVYYGLFRHRNFTWFPQLEAIRVGQIETTMNALHEKKFAGAAAAKARAGLAIIDRTHRSLYEEGARDPWLVQRDSRTNRVWGVGEWGARVGMGAYLDWVMANALLPSEIPATNTINPLAVIDRTTVPELTEIVLAAKDVQNHVDMADRGLNPLGLGAGSVPFDISPAEIDQGKTHFEQAYEKALEALKVARAVFDRVQTATAAIRDQNEQRDLDTMILEQEQTFDRRLIDIYGFPHLEDMGPGKAFPEGYIGPDTKNYFYINRYDYFGRIPLDTRQIEASIVVPTVIGTGIRKYDPGEIAPKPPPPDNSLTLGDIIQFVSPEYAQKYEEIKSKYTDVRDGMTKADVDALGIPEVTAFYNDVTSAYSDIEAAVIGAVEDAVAWFDGVISGPVDAIDSFISQWVGPEQELTELKVNGPNIGYTTNNVVFWVGPDGLPMKPASYTSNRRAEGEIQIALSQFVLSLREATKAINDAKNEYKKVLAADTAFRQTVGAQMTAYYNDVNALDNLNALEKIIAVVEKVIALVEKVYGAGKEVYESLEAATPSIVGLANDIGAAVKGPARIAAAAVNVAGIIQKLVNGETIVQRSEDIELGKKIIELNKTAAGIFKTSTEMAQKVVDQAAEYMKALDALDVALQKAEGFRMQYARAVAQGDLIQVEREQARTIWATDLTGRRYRNMAYQIIRNDDLARYEQTFAMASRYVYLAAKAYDYETGLLRSDATAGEAGREFLSQIVRARALGRFTGDGTPLPGGSTGDPGLADIMARMAANWSVLDGRLNFNNPQTETGMFSLRKELFRIPDGAAFDPVWRQTLQDHLVDDVFDLVEFRTFCLPFTPSFAAEPALVIPFNSTIDFRRNFFDKPLGPGDNAYDSTHFATKIRSVGVWFANYRSTVLANQPRVYLVPVGEDRMRVPDGVGETVRTWSVLDQALPIPYQLSNESWMSSDWRVSTDVLGGEFFLRRRFPSLRAYHDDGFDVSQMSPNARLIGRSVWNSKWLLIIPGGTLLNDADKGLQQFINGRELSPGSGTYDGQGVKDIKVFFQTYSYSGN